MGSGSEPFANATRSTKTIRVNSGFDWDHWDPRCSDRLGPNPQLTARGRQVRAWINENDQANRAISTGQLHALPRFHIQPINVVVFHGSQGNTSFEGGFPLRCFQRLSRPDLATLQCGWRHNRSTRDPSNPVLSY